MPKWFKTKEKGETVKLYITDPNAESWGGSTKVDIGLTIVTKLEGEEGEQTPHHYAVEVTQYGIADQFGIRVHDELLLLNFFPISGKTQGGVVQLFKDEIVGRKSRLFFRRKVEQGETVVYYYHYVTGYIELVEQPIHGDDQEKPLHVEYQVNHIHHTIFREGSFMYLPPDYEYFSNVESERYLCYENDLLYATVDFDESDKFLFAIIMDPENSKVFIRHDLGCADTYAFMDEQQDESIVMKKEPIGPEGVPQNPKQGETMILIAVHNRLRTYAFQSTIENHDSFYLSTSGSDVIMKQLPGGTLLGDDQYLQFQLFAEPYCKDTCKC